MGGRLTVTVRAPFASCEAWEPGQVSTSAQYPYVSILIDGGETSNVNTKPERLEDTMP